MSSFEADYNASAQRQKQRDEGERKNKQIAYLVIAVVIGMVGMAYAAVPLYDLFCRVTGYGGTTQVAGDQQSAPLLSDRDIKVRFNAMNHRDMPWVFRPKNTSAVIKVGERAIAYYEAYNPTDQIITGTATYNVTPHKIGPYFIKIDCFCFTEQTLKPGERVDMPVIYYIDPDMIEEDDLSRVHEITLSYTFFRKESALSQIVAKAEDRI